MNYFTSDTHYKHTNIIKYCNRPFADVDDMKAVLIINWNSVVKPEDTVYHLGDFGLGGIEQAEVEAILSILNGTKVLITGNHDSGKVKSATGWNLVTKHMNITGDSGYKLDMIHKPADAEKLLPYTPSKLVLHGHQHGSPELHAYKKVAGWTYYDVGVDPNDYTPVNENHILTKLFGARPHD